MEKYIHQLQNADFHTRMKVVKAHRKGEKSKKTKYCDDVFTFDIEVSSGWINNGRVIKYHAGESADYWNNLEPVALCYIWQFSYNDKVYYGRELRDFKKLLEDIPSDMKVIIWVHNLAYEFQFLCNLFEWDMVFAKNPHKPMKCVPSDFPNIEFRCTYMLTRLSLDTWGKQLGVLKHTGDLDYEELRTPYTELTEKELSYCEYDCLVVYAGVKSYIKRYGNPFDIPLTQTGTVRQEVKNRLMSDAKYVKFIKTLVPKTAKEYKMLMQVFAGGYTHANRFYAGIPITGNITHRDFTSSYPTWMIAGKYPMTPWIYTAEHELPDISTFDDVAYIMKLKFRRLNCKTCNTYIQASKCNGKNFLFDNGRVISADECELYCTEQDYLTISETYTWESVEVEKLYKSYKDYLPAPFMDYILELYHNKTNYKGVKGMEEIYMQSKQYINSMFGMCVTAIVQADVDFDGSSWSVRELTEDYVQNKLDKLRSWSPRERRYFLSYSWGCWVTAYARRALWMCIEKCDDDMIYCDTDSIFVEGDPDFTWYDTMITEKLRKACETMGLDFNKTHPKAPDGKEKPLGLFTKEDDCTEFITLGAKRYVERRKSDGKLHLTVSGINKGAVELLHDDIENFQDGLDFDKDAPCVNKRLATYLDDMPETIWDDGYISTYKYGINLRRNGYKLTMTDEYKQLIDYMQIDSGAIAESFYNKLRNTFV